MPLRGFGIQTLSGTAQPVFGTTLSAAITGLTTDRYTGNTDPRSQASTSSAVVVSTNFFRVGDRVVVGPAGGPWDEAQVTKITAGTPPAGTLALKGLTTTHASGEFVILAIACAGFSILPIVVGSTMYIGEDSTTGVASATLIYALTTTQAAAGVDYSPSRAMSGNVLDTPKLWINGTAADKYLPSVLLI